jgi:ABC-type amino acid transport system permease subunit
MKAKAYVKGFSSIFLLLKGLSFNMPLCRSGTLVAFVSLVYGIIFSRYFSEGSARHNILGPSLTIRPLGGREILFPDL